MNAQEGLLLNEQELVDWGERVGRGANPPLFIALRGDLGAGKTTLARAIARGAGVEGPIPSPTFNLLFRYQTVRGVEVAHLDLYRLEDSEEVWELGWAELPGSSEIVLVEWPERAGTLLPDDRWEVEIVEAAGGALRLLTVTPVGRPGRLPPGQEDR